MPSRSNVDSQRLARLVQSPGIDPRTWITVAVVTALGFDAEHGIFADIQFINDGTIETASLGAPYSINGGGMYLPVEVGDLVYVAVPDGNPDYGPVIIARGWNKSIKPPPEANEGGTPGDDPVWRIKDKQTLHLLTKDGKISIVATGAGTVEITSAASVTIKGASAVNVQSDSKVDVQSSGTVTVQGTGVVDVKSASTVNVEAPQVNLGPAAVKKLVARLGDAVTVVVPTFVAPPGPPVTVVGSITAVSQAAVKA